MILSLLAAILTQASVPPPPPEEDPEEVVVAARRLRYPVTRWDAVPGRGLRNCRILRTSGDTVVDREICVTLSAGDPANPAADPLPALPAKAAPTPADLLGTATRGVTDRRTRTTPPDTSGPPG